MYALQTAEGKSWNTLSGKSLDTLLFQMSNPRFHGGQKHRLVKLHASGRVKKVLINR